MSSARRPAVGFIFVTLVLDILGLGLIIPILPKLIEELHGGNTAVAAHTVGLLGSLFAIMQFVCSPILGSLSDRWGRRPIILASLLGSGFDYLLLAWAPTLPWFFIGRIVAGITSSNISAASAYIADVTPPEKRAASFGMIGAAFGIGFVLGPALGGWLGEHHLRLPFFISAGLVFANWLYGYFVLPESLPLEHRRPFSWAKANPLGSLQFLSRTPFLLRMAAALLLINMSHFILHNVWVLYTGYRYQWTPTEVGFSLTLVGVLSGMVQGLLAGRIVGALGEGPAILVGVTLSTLAFIGYGLAPTGKFIYGALLVGCLSGFSGPALQSLLSRQVGPSEQGALQGALTSLTSVANIVAPLIATSAFAWGIAPHREWSLPGLPFFLSASFATLGGLLTLLALRAHPPTPSGPVGAHPTNSASH